MAKEGKLSKISKSLNIFNSEEDEDNETDFEFQEKNDPSILEMFHNLSSDVQDIKTKFEEIENAITLVAENTVGLEDVISKMETKQTQLLAAQELIDKELNKLVKRLSKIEITAEKLETNTSGSEKMISELVEWAAIEKQKLKHNSN